jgi:4-aminobutyrate aminotransferase-like enzyme
MSSLPFPRVPDVRVPPPGPRSREILKRQRRVLYPGLDHESNPFVARRKVDYAIEDVDGNVYLDMSSGWGSTPLGACPPEVLEATVGALSRYGVEDSHHLTSEPVLALAEKLVSIAPEGLTRVDIALSGTEAVEIALRLMRRATGRPLILGFFGQYHGETLGAAALGAELAGIGRGVREITPGFVHAPYPNPYRSPFADPRPGGTGDATVDYIRDYLLFHAVDPSDVAGVVIEPIAGEGGVLIPPDAFWPALVDLCREHGWLLCADEVESGFGRTGKLFSVEHWDVHPDLMCLAKAFSGGVMPIAAVLGTEEVMGSFDDTETGSTWSWLPAACAGALRAIEVFERDRVLDNVLRLEEVAHRTLGGLPSRFEVVGDVRIKGTYIAIEFVKDRATKERAPEFQHLVEQECVRRGLVVITHNAALRVLPSLTMPPEVFEQGMAIIGDSIAAALEMPVLEA